VPIEPALVPLLTYLTNARGRAGLLFPSPMGRGDAAEMLRECLRWVGVTRTALYAKDDGRKRLTWHDLRGTGITWRCVRGDNHVAIKTQAGHESFETTLGYIASADALRSGFGVPFPALPAVLWDGASGYPAATENGTGGFPAATECPRRDSNPATPRPVETDGDIPKQLREPLEHAATSEDIGRPSSGYRVAETLSEAIERLNHPSELSQLEAIELAAWREAR
jgi:hypothetical protein